MIRAAFAAALLALLLATPAAQARQLPFIGGIVPDVPTGTHVRPPGPAHIANLPYGGGRVLHWNRTHLIFWQPAGSGLTFDARYQQLISAFLAGVAADSRSATNVYGLSGQYSDSGGPAAYNSTYGGTVVATDPLPANGCTEPSGPPAGDGPGWSHCLSDGQLVGEIRAVIRAQRLPTTNNDIYFLMVPNGLGSCVFAGPDYCSLGGSTNGSYCGYHASTSDGLLYAVIPYNAVPGHCQSGNPRPNSSTADPTISSLSHEHNETVTDPFGDAWIDQATNSEDGDLCISSFGPVLGGSGQTAFNEVIRGGHYYLQEEWSNEDGSCQPRDETNRLSVTVPAHPHAHAPAAFTAHASDPDGAIVFYNWFFGDRGSARSRHASHVFRRAGEYRVVLRTTDTSGNWTFDAVTVRVAKGASKDLQRRGKSHRRSDRSRR